MNERKNALHSLTSLAQNDTSAAGTAAEGGKNSSQSICSGWSLTVSSHAESELMLSLNAESVVGMMRGSSMKRSSWISSLSIVTDCSPLPPALSASCAFTRSSTSICSLKIVNTSGSVFFSS